VGKLARTDTSSFIKGDLEILAVQTYIDCFTAEERSGRFFRKLRLTKDSKVVSSITPIGKNSCASVGKQIAAFLNLPDFKKYTGHCWRGTAATILADEGFTTQEIKRKFLGFIIFIAQMFFSY